MSRDQVHDEALRRLGARIQQIRLHVGATQEELAEQAGIDVQSLQRAERGAAQMPLGKLVRVSKALKTPLENLFIGLTPEVTALAAEPDERLLRRVRELMPSDRDVVEKLVEFLADR